MVQNRALGLLSFLFFAFGFITCLNDLLVPHLKNSFDLDYTRSILVQFCFFTAYFVISPPSGKIVEKIGYKKGVIVGLIIMAVGCGLFGPAAKAHSFNLFLMALFVLAGGIALLQVAANPYIARLGAPETASRRLTLVQAFNSLGTAIAPIIGAALIFRAGFSGAESVVGPYTGLAFILILLAVGVHFTTLPEIKEESEESSKPAGKLSDYPHLILGILGIFFYVGSEVAIGSFLVSLMGLPEMGGMMEVEAAKYVSIYWTGAMIGRFAGSAYMQKIGPAHTLLYHALAAVVLIAGSFLFSGLNALGCLLLVGYCNSIMFPTIFTQALDGVGGYTKKGSALLCMAIVGGALLPLVQAQIADSSIGLRLSYLVPLVGYLYIAYFGFYRTRKVA
ncbi:MAG: sugar MFS transporter [Bacteriovoracaceae bacterium]|nr:sugar MFS transporter [Bacteriovoracaceae bacterium]